MTRFKMELSGMLGEFWKKQAEQELQKVKSDLDSCRITIDGDGVARNCIGRALADAAERDEVLKRYASREIGAEEMHEMRSAFGTGATVVDVLTGRRYAV